MIVATVTNRNRTLAGWEFSYIPSSYSQELDLLEKEREETAMRIFEAMTQRDREILTRFYFNGETREQICTDMNLSTNQFRLLKSRAKARLSERGRRRFGAN
jgi:DNA-directed RNA polymerase specialized sigma24 family protein